MSSSRRIVAPAGLIMTVTAAIVAATLAWAELKSTDTKYADSLRVHSLDLINHQDRISKLEQNQAKIELIRNDVDWIRQMMEGRFTPKPNPIPNNR